MENNELLDLLEQEYLQEYRKIQNRLLKKIRESSYLNVPSCEACSRRIFTMGMKRPLSMESCVVYRSRCC